MNTKLLSLALSLIVVAFPLPAVSDDDIVEQFGDWTVTTRQNSEYSTNPLCVLTSSGDDPRFILANIPDTNVSGPMRGSARLDLRLPGTLLDDDSGEIEAVRVVVPNQFTWAGTKETWSETRTSSRLRLIVFVDPKIDSVTQPLALGNKLAIEIDAGGRTTTYSYDLAGSYTAIVAYEKCLAQVNWINSAEADES